MSAEKKSTQSESSGGSGKSGSAAPPSQDIFDVRKIRRLVELMKEHDLSQIDLRQGETRIQLQRGGPALSADSVLRPVLSSLPAAEKPTAPAAKPPAEEEHVLLIKSPMVGTFYASPDPDSPSYVKVGDHVGPETTVCIVEAMKVFNEIPAEIAGKILTVLVENGEPVEFGQPLFKVDTQG